MGYITDFAVKNDLNNLMKTVKDKGTDTVKEAKDLRKNTILHIACWNSNHDIVDFAIRLGVNVNAPNVAGDTPLILSAKKGDIEAAKKLIEAGSKGIRLYMRLGRLIFRIVNQFNQHGNTALHYACFWRFAELALYLAKAAGGYIKIANHYNALPIDHTSKQLYSVLSEISKDQGGGTVIRAQSLENIVDKVQIDIGAVNDWIAEASNIVLGDPLTSTEFANTFSAVYRSAKAIVKIPNLNRDIEDEEIAVIKKEIGAIRKAYQSFLVPVLCACLESPDVCYVLPWEEGGNLKTLLADSSIWLSITDAMQYAMQVCKALIYLNELKPEFIAHGNLKTSNILIVKDGKLALSDFGFSKSIFHPINGDSPKMRMNIIEWAAPEILAGEEGVTDDLRPCDVYSFGLVLYSIMTRQPLFSITNEMVLGYMIAKEGLVPVVPEYIPASLTTIMEQCWLFEPSKRPPIRQVYQELLKLKF